MTTVLLGRQVGLRVCSHCRNTVRAAGAARVRCPRCGAPIHVRKPHSVVTTGVLLAGFTLHLTRVAAAAAKSLF